MDAIDDLKRLAGITASQSHANNTDTHLSGTQRSELMKQHNIKPGTDAWFRLWFSRPQLTGEKPFIDK